MNSFKVIALTHHKLPLELIGKLHIEVSEQRDFLREVKARVRFKELALLSTCNRVEFILSCPQYICPGRLKELFSSYSFQDDELEQLLEHTIIYRGEEAIRHLMAVGSSLDSMVIGEREILAQLKTTFDTARDAGTSGQILNLLSKSIVNTCKKVFTETKIATKPVSVVSLGWFGFYKRAIPITDPILLIGSGQTNSNFSRFLKKSGYLNVTIVNRTIAKAKSLANQHETWTALGLDQLHSHRRKYSAIVTCTGANDPLLSKPLFDQLTDNSFQILIDMALPSDTSTEVIETIGNKFIGLDVIKKKAETNLNIRAQEIEACQNILDLGFEKIKQQFKEREVEIAMRDIPQLIKNIKATAIGEIFKKDLDQLDENSKEVLETILTYMEKKYISLPMKLAREVLLNQTHQH